MSNVYIAQEGRHDFSAAKRYGELHYILKTGQERTSTKLYDFVYLLEKAMRNSDKEDYIVMSGYTSLCCLMCALFATKHNMLNLLIWDKNRQKYITRKFALPQKELQRTLHQCNS